MSTLTQVEQATPITPPSAGQQMIYPKAGVGLDGGIFMMASDGMEMQIVMGKGSQSGSLMMYTFQQYGGM